MKDQNIQTLIDNPRPLLDTLQGPRGVVFRRSNLFRRDLQYGLWRYLNRDQSKYPYHKMELLSDELIKGWIGGGVIREIGRQTYELLLTEYQTPTASGAAPAEPAGSESARDVSASTPEVASAPPVPSEEEKQRKIAELQRKMAEAKAKREAGG